MLNEGGTLYNPSSRGGFQCFFSVISFYFLFFFTTGFTESHVIIVVWLFLGQHEPISIHLALGTVADQKKQFHLGIAKWMGEVWTQGQLCGPEVHPSVVMSHENCNPGLPAQLAGCFPSWRVSSSWQLLLFVSSRGEACEPCKFQELPRLCKSFTYVALCFIYFPSLRSLLSLQVGLFQFRGNSYITLIAQFILNNVWCYELWRT